MTYDQEERLNFIEDCLEGLADPFDRCILIRLENKMEQGLMQEWLRAGLVVFNSSVGIYDKYELNA